MSQRLVQDGLAVTRPDTSLTNEEVQDIIGAMLSGNTETLITVTYQDVDGTIDFVVDNNLANYSNTVAGFISDITGSPLSELQDVTITSIASGEILKWNGSAWVNNTLAEAGIAAASHTHTAANITDFATSVDARIALASIDDLADVTVTAVTDGEVLLYDSGTSQWINQTFAEADIAPQSEQHLDSFLLGGM